jgi:hypothetical protein
MVFLTHKYRHIVFIKWSGDQHWQLWNSGYCKVETRNQERKGGETRKINPHGTLFVKKDKPERASLHSFPVIMQSPVSRKSSLFGIIYIIKV